MLFLHSVMPCLRSSPICRCSSSFCRISCCVALEPDTAAASCWLYAAFESRREPLWAVSWRWNSLALAESFESLRRMSSLASLDCAYSSASAPRASPEPRKSRLHLRAPACRRSLAACTRLPRRAALPWGRRRKSRCRALLAANDMGFGFACPWTPWKLNVCPWLPSQMLTEACASDAAPPSLLPDAWSRYLKAEESCLERRNSRWSCSLSTPVSAVVPTIRSFTSYIAPRAVLIPSFASA
mmetsp:Transcript_48684/g.155565  ORF Transcript_48684/g.155565 Transcript_48684/m.155565 type:complete len:241 (+) Transcript_48684:1668-2390(+)